MTKNEIVARWMGVETKDETAVYPLLYKAGPLRQCKDSDYPDHTYYSANRLMYNRSYDWLMPAWVKFRDLKFDENRTTPDVTTHRIFSNSIRTKITDSTIAEAFDELVKGIEWYNSINNANKTT